MPRLLRTEPVGFDRVRNTYVATEGDAGHVAGTQYEEITSTSPPPTQEQLDAAAAHDAAAKARIEERRALRQSGGSRWMIGQDGKGAFLGQEEP